MKKSIIYILAAGILFVYGFSVSHFRIFPHKQLKMLEEQIAVFYGTNINPIKEFEENQQTLVSGDVEILDTFLTRLLLKKIPIPNYTGHGGGVASTDNWLFLITNKGSVRAYNLENTIVSDVAFPDVPMDLDALAESGHLYKNEFRHRWYRVNGVHAEYGASENRVVLFASHNGYNSEQDCITHNISKLEIGLESDALNIAGEWETLFTAEPCIDPEPDYILARTDYPGHISGGDMLSFDQDHLLVTVGDYNRHGIDNSTDEFAVDPSIPYGKHILLDKETGDWSVFSIGNRNPSGIFRDDENTIWSVENGPEAGDELNIISEGENYGWPKVSYGIWYSPEFNLPGGQSYGSHENYRKPVFSWIPSVAPSSITKIQNDKFELWNGDLIVGTMGNQSLRRLRLDDTNHVTYDERIYLGHRVRDLHTLSDGKIVVLTDDGFLIFVEDGGPAFQKDLNVDTLKISGLNAFDNFIDSEAFPNENMVSGNAQTIFEQNCASCHNLNNESQIGPHLSNLFEREIGGADDFNYSSVLRRDDRVWSPELLRAFLNNPEAEFRGNRMQQVRLTAAETDSIIHYLEKFN